MSPGPHEYTAADLEGGDLKDEMQRLRKSTMQFAFGLDDDRNPVMLMHRTRKAQTLRKDMKGKLGVNRPTYGTATADGKTVVMQLEGPRLPQMEKQVKLLLRKEGIGTFSKAIVLAKGEAPPGGESDGEDEEGGDGALVEELRQERVELQSMERDVKKTLRLMADGKPADRKVLARYVKDSVKFAKRSKRAGDRELKTFAKDVVGRSKKTAEIVKRVDRAQGGAKGAKGGGEPVPKASTKLTASVGKNGKNKPEDVVAVQQLLNDSGGAKLDVDGRVGPKTIRAIGVFQKQKGGPVDGRVDPGGKTWQALNAG